MYPEKELGPLIALYPHRRRITTGLLAFYVPGILLVLAPLGYGIYQAGYAYTHFGPAAADDWSRPWYLLSLGILLIFILAALLWTRRLYRSVAVHHNGLRLALPRPLELRWTQIAGIASQIQREHFFGLTLRTRQQVWLFPTLGRPVRLDPLPDLNELVTQIKAHLYPRLLPNLRKDFNTGAWLQFGPIAIQARGLRANGREYPWEEIDQVTIRKGDLVISFADRVKRPPRRLAAGSIPNLELLIQILQGYQV